MTPTYASQREKHPPNLSGLKRSVDVCDAPRLSRLTEGLCSSSSLQGPDPATSWRTPAAQQKRPIPPTPHTHTPTRSVPVTSAHIALAKVSRMATLTPSRQGIIILPPAQKECCPPCLVTRSTGDHAHEAVVG